MALSTSIGFGPDLVHRENLAILTREAREKLGLAQTEVANRIGAPATWVGLVERQGAGTHVEAMPRIEALAKFLSFAIPHLGTDVKEEPRKTLSLPTIVKEVPKPAIAPDVELSVIHTCSVELQKLGNDREACQRVLGYLRARYGLPPRDHLKP